MTLAEILTSLFPGDATCVADGLIAGKGRLPGGGDIHVLGIAGTKPLGVDGALALAGRVLDIARTGDGTPILVLIDSSSQRMSRRDELLGLSEYLAHLAKALLLAERRAIARSACSMAAAPRAPSSRPRLPPARWWRCPARIRR